MLLNKHQQQKISPDLVSLTVARVFVAFTTLGFYPTYKQIEYFFCRALLFEISVFTQFFSSCLTLTSFRGKACNNTFVKE